MHCRATSYHHIFSDLTALDRTDQLEKNIQLACIIFFNIAKHAVVYLYLPCGVMLNSHTLSTETHWIVSVTTMSCVLDCSQVSVLQSQNLWNVHSKALLFDLLFFTKTTIFKWKKLMFRDKALIESYFLPTCPEICRNICLICACHRLLLFCWQEKFK